MRRNSSHNYLNLKTDNFPNDFFAEEKNCLAEQSNLYNDKVALNQKIPIRANHLISPKQRQKTFQFPLQNNHNLLNKFQEGQIETPCFKGDLTQAKNNKKVVRSKLSLKIPKEIQKEKLIQIPKIQMEQISKEAQKCLSLLQFQKIFHSNSELKNKVHKKLEHAKNVAFNAYQMTQNNSSLSNLGNISNGTAFNNFSLLSPKNLTFEISGGEEISFEEKKNVKILGQFKTGGKKFPLLKPVQHTRKLKSCRSESAIPSGKQIIKNQNEIKNVDPLLSTRVQNGLIQRTSSLQKQLIDLSKLNSQILKERSESSRSYLQSQKSDQQHLNYINMQQMNQNIKANIKIKKHFQKMFYKLQRDLNGQHSQRILIPNLEELKQQGYKETKSQNKVQSYGYENPQQIAKTYSKLFNCYQYIELHKKFLLILSWT